MTNLIQRLFRITRPAFRVGDRVAYFSFIPKPGDLGNVIELDRKARTYTVQWDRVPYAIPGYREHELKHA
jgi:hypothetical protein